MIQRLFWLLAVLGLGWMLRRLVAGMTRQQASTRPGKAVPLRDEGPMVRDRVCNTFLPRSRAVPLAPGEEEQFFCSERCRETYLKRRAG